MNPEGYRIVLIYDGEREGFVGRIPELGEEVFAPSRAEALAAAENKIEELIRQAAEKGEALPPPIDSKPPAEELKLKLSVGLQRDLEFAAKEQGVPLEQLCGELLAAALGGKRTPRAAERERTDEGGEKPRRRPYGGSRNYFNIMDDKASFLEYVRSLETGPGPGRGGGRRGGRRG